MVSYLQIENLTKSFGELVLFENISFSVHKDQKVALIAKNGSGKTTLLNIIAGKDTQDSGNVIFKNDISVGYLEQSPKFDDDKTVIEQVFASSNKIVEVVRDYENSLHSNDKNYMQKAIEQMDFYKAWDYEARIKIILSQLKINDFEQKVKELSGGQKKRLAIANVLINEPDFLILDEPTNHLDVELIEWLEDYLAKSKCTLLMVTHDRYFLDRVCNEIIELDENSAFSYKGNYSYFLEKRQERMELHNLTVEKAQNLYKKELEWSKRMPKARTTKAKYRMDNVKELEQKAKGKIVDENVQINVQTRRIGKKILEIKNVSKKFEKINIVNDFSYSFVNEEKIGIVGNNGIGKTTFLNIITGDIIPDTGKIDKGQTIVYGYYKQSGIQFDSSKRVIDIIQEIADNITLGNGSVVSASKFLEFFLFPPQMHYNKVEKLSGGELKRLYLMTVLMKNPNFLILDEPSNDLDIATLSVLEEYLLSFKGCVLIVSHDRYFMDKVVDNLFVFEGDGKIMNFVGKYSDYFDYKEQLDKEQKNTEKIKEKKPEKVKNEQVRKMTFKEKQLFDQLEKEIPELQSKITQIENELSSGTLQYQDVYDKSVLLDKLKNELDEKEMTWLELSEIGK